MILYPIEELEKNLSQVNIDHLLQVSPIPLNKDLLNHESYGKALKIYVLLSDSSLFSQEEPSKVFYNRYYWFLNFLEKYKLINGNDAGLEQQAFQMLENFESINGEIDWEIIEQLQNQVITKERAVL